jgi:hypothetical protein
MWFDSGTGIPRSLPVPGSRVQALIEPPGPPYPDDARRVCHVLQRPARRSHSCTPRRGDQQPPAWCTHNPNPRLNSCASRDHTGRVASRAACSRLRSSGGSRPGSRSGCASTYTGQEPAGQQQQLNHCLPSVSMYSSRTPQGAPQRSRGGRGLASDRPGRSRAPPAVPFSFQRACARKGARRVPVLFCLPPFHSQEPRVHSSPVDLSYMHIWLVEFRLFA